MGLQNPGPAWLFCPADRPERYQKAAAAADVVILDLKSLICRP
jgi:citrate lyase subunit beta/citryl-CoA lyase